MIELPRFIIVFSSISVSVCVHESARVCLCVCLTFFFWFTAAELFENMPVDWICPPSSSLSRVFCQKLLDSAVHTPTSQRDTHTHSCSRSPSLSLSISVAFPLFASIICVFDLTQFNALHSVGFVSILTPTPLSTELSTQLPFVAICQFCNILSYLCLPLFFFF